MQIRLSVAGYLLILFFSTIGNSQVKEINGTAFTLAMWSATDATEKVFPRREVTTEEAFKNNKLTETRKNITEYASSDHMRSITRTETDRRTSTSEIIQIGKIYFCRENKSRWRRSKNYCSRTEITGTTESQSKYTLAKTTENDKDVTILSEYSTWKGPGGKDEFYFENRFWLSSDGKFLRKEFVDGKLPTKEIQSKSTSVYEYGIQIDPITAPTK